MLQPANGPPCVAPVFGFASSMAERIRALESCLQGPLSRAASRRTSQCNSQPPPITSNSAVGTQADSATAMVGRNKECARFTIDLEHLEAAPPN